MSRVVLTGSKTAVHPHMRGDNDYVSTEIVSHIGSPPHAWGQSGIEVISLFQFRFTPTCVGTMEANMGSRRMRAVHPHMRGDNFEPLMVYQCGSGSPPHAWGQCKEKFNKLENKRFTPTCVGTIRGLDSRTTSCTVHPHMRGDNTKITNN